MKIETRQLHVPIIRPIKKFTALSDAGTGVVQLFFLVLGGYKGAFEGFSGTKESPKGWGCLATGWRNVSEFHAKR
jgi:hypothetical protein